MSSFFFFKIYQYVIGSYVFIPPCLYFVLFINYFTFFSSVYFLTVVTAWFITFLSHERLWKTLLDSCWSEFFQPFKALVYWVNGVQFGLKSYAWFQNPTSTQLMFDLKSQVWFQTKIAQHEVRLPLFHIYFEIATFSRSNTGFFIIDMYKCFINLVFSWFVKSCKSCLLFSCNLIDFFEQAFKSYWLS